MDDPEYAFRRMGEITPEEERLARLLCRQAGYNPASDWRRQGVVMLDVADDQPEMWRRFAATARATIAKSAPALSRTDTKEG